MFGVTIATASLYAGFQVLKVVDLKLVVNVLHIIKKKSIGVKSGGLGGQAIGPPLPIYLPAISLSR
jgi:hypothetical protein